MTKRRMTHLFSNGDLPPKSSQYGTCRPTKLGKIKDLHAEVQAAVVGLADAPSPPRSSPLQAGRAQGPQPAELSCHRVLVIFASAGRR